MRRAGRQRLPASVSSLVRFRSEEWSSSRSLFSLIAGRTVAMLLLLPSHRLLLPHRTD